MVGLVRLLTMPAGTLDITFAVVELQLPTQLAVFRCTVPKGAAIGRAITVTYACLGTIWKAQALSRLLWYVAITRAAKAHTFIIVITVIVNQLLPQVTYISSHTLSFAATHGGVTAVLVMRTCLSCLIIHVIGHLLSWSHSFVGRFHNFRGTLGWNGSGIRSWIGQSGGILCCWRSRLSGCIGRLLILWTRCRDIGLLGIIRH